MLQSCPNKQKCITKLSKQAKMQPNCPNKFTGKLSKQTVQTVQTNSQENCLNKQQSQIKTKQTALSKQQTASTKTRKKYGNINS